MCRETGCRFAANNPVSKLLHFVRHYSVISLGKYLTNTGIFNYSAAPRLWGHCFHCIMYTTSGIDKHVGCEGATCGTPKQKRTHARTHTTHTHARTHARTRARTHTHTPTHTHTHHHHHHPQHLHHQSHTRTVVVLRARRRRDSSW